MTDLPTDPTIDEIRAALAPLVASHAAFDGWTAAAVEAAAMEARVAPAVARLAFDGDAIAMIDAWFVDVDARMIAACSPENLAPLSVRGRIQTLMEARLAALAPHREALRRALSILALPTNLVRAGKLGWRAADLIWRAAGDDATDLNHYTKRASLAAIYSSTLLCFLNDDSDDHGDTRAFLARRLASVVQLEKAKARWRARSEHRPSLARFVGRLRYHAR
ncbi:MAG: RpsU-divergently transcribed [Sphingobium sp. 32-64-5]|nr:MAG: RpsU-divergently transcribed [Sphingobium sp. 32-64-5]